MKTRRNIWWTGLAIVLAATLCAYKIPGSPGANTTGDLTVNGNLTVTGSASISGGSGLKADTVMTFDLSGSNPFDKHYVTISGAVRAKPCSVGTQGALLSDSLMPKAQCVANNVVAVTMFRVCGSTLVSRTDSVHVVVHQ